MALQTHGWPSSSGDETLQLAAAAGEGMAGQAYAVLCPRDDASARLHERRSLEACDGDRAGAETT